MNKSGAAPSLITRPFVLLCLTMFLGYANQWVMTPIIPLYVQKLGGSPFVSGLALLTFAVPAFVFRPFAGHIADRWSAAGVLACGLILLAAGSLIFLIPWLVMVFVGGIVRGIGWAGTNTGGYTTLATTTPSQRRGEAAGYYTSVTASATIVFPALALWLANGRGGFDAVFLASTLLALAGLPTILMLTKIGEEPVKSAQAVKASAALLDKGVLLATGLNLCSTLAVPSVMAFLPLYAHSLGIKNIGLFYVMAGITSIVVRPILGKRSDAMGRGPAVALGLGSQLIGMVLIAIAHSLPLMLAGGFFVALGIAMIGAATTALAMDLANPHARGRAMATFSISYQIGAGLGSVIAGTLADLLGLRGMYVGSIVITLAGLGLLVSAWKLLPKPAA